MKATPRGCVMDTKDSPVTPWVTSPDHGSACCSCLYLVQDSPQVVAAGIRGLGSWVGKKAGLAPVLLLQHSPGIGAPGQVPGQVPV